MWALPYSNFSWVGAGVQPPGSEVTSCLPLPGLVPMEDTGVVTTMDGKQESCRPLLCGSSRNRRCGNPAELMLRSSAQ